MNDVHAAFDRLLRAITDARTAAFDLAIALTRERANADGFAVVRFAVHREHAARAALAAACADLTRLALEEAL